MSEKIFTSLIKNGGDVNMAKIVWRLERKGKNGPRNVWVKGYWRTMPKPINQKRRQNTSGN